MLLHPDYPSDNPLSNNFQTVCVISTHVHWVIFLALEVQCHHDKFRLQRSRSAAYHFLNSKFVINLNRDHDNMVVVIKRLSKDCLMKAIAAFWS